MFQSLKRFVRACVVLCMRVIEGVSKSRNFIFSINPCEPFMKKQQQRMGGGGSPDGGHPAPASLQITSCLFSSQVRLTSVSVCTRGLVLHKSVVYSKECLAYWKALSTVSSASACQPLALSTVTVEKFTDYLRHMFQPNCRKEEGIRSGCIKVVAPSSDRSALSYMTRTLEQPVALSRKTKLFAEDYDKDDLQHLPARATHACHKPSGITVL